MTRCLRRQWYLSSGVYYKSYVSYKNNNIIYILELRCAHRYDMLGKIYDK